jgi:hypothetical protein
MSAFDSTWQTLGVSVGVPEDDGPLELMLTVGNALPTPQGPVPIPLGVHRFVFTREQAISLFEKGLEEAQKMPKKSDIVTATNMSSVEKVAENIKKFGG